MGARWSLIKAEKSVVIEADEKRMPDGNRGDDRDSAILTKRLSMRLKACGTPDFGRGGCLTDSLRGGLKGDYSDANGRAARTEKYRGPVDGVN